jgi:hypothetical protein
MRFIEIAPGRPGFNRITISVLVINTLGTAIISVTMSFAVSQSRAETGMLLTIQSDFPSIEMEAAVVVPMETIQPSANGMIAISGESSGISRKFATASA